MKTYIDWIAPTFILSLAGLPVASVPAGIDSRSLPVGIQIVGPPRERKGFSSSLTASASRFRSDCRVVTLEGRSRSRVEEVAGKFPLGPALGRFVSKKKRSEA